MEKALARFKFISYLAGVVLILFTIEITLKYSGVLEIPWFAQLHGIVYMAFQLSNLYECCLKVEVKMKLDLGLIALNF